MPPLRPDRVLIHPDVLPAYEAIELAAAMGRKREGSLWRSIERAWDRVSDDAQWGEVIPRIPARFVERYKPKNLYCVDLALFHRAFYTIEGLDVVFLDIVDHPTYDKWFPGRGR